MAEAGVDISGQVPQHVAQCVDDTWDLVFTVCDSTVEMCPVFPKRVATLHLSFPDPARATGTEDEQLAVFRSVRDDIRTRLLPAIREFEESPSRHSGRPASH
jgi:arsenate reductase